MDASGRRFGTLGDDSETIAPTVVSAVMRLRRRTESELEVIDLIDQCLALAAGDTDTTDLRQAAITMRLKRIAELKFLG